MIERIISGGQVGADRGGLDAAQANNVLCGGWCPAGRRAEDGSISTSYPLQETEEWDYPPRTRLNVAYSDGTVVFTVGPPTGGSALTIKIAEEMARPCLHVDLQYPDDAVEAVADWIDGYRLRIINVAGSRESKAPGIQEAVTNIMSRVIQELRDT